MMESKSVHMPTVSHAPTMRFGLMDKAGLIERLAREMRLASGNELPHSFCVAQIERELADKQMEAAASGHPTVTPVVKVSGNPGSVFRSWAMRE